MVRIIILIVALLLGGVSAWLVSSGLQAPTAAVSDAAVATQAPGPEILVTTGEFGQGKRLDPAMLAWRAWPTESIGDQLISREAHPDAITTFSGAVVRSGFAAGEPIREDKLVLADSGFMSALLTSGKRAVAVRISAENTAGGFILPNDRVDVIHTLAQPGADGGPARSISRTVLANVRVLAIDQTVNEAGADTIAVGKTATLELSPEQVEIAAAAEASGGLSLALRSIEDNDEPTAQAPEVIVQAAASEAAEVTVRIIGSGRSQMVTTKAAAGN